MSRSGWEVPLVPGRTRAALEGLGSNLAETYYKEQIDRLQPIPAEDFFDVKLGTDFDVISGPDGDLPAYVEGLTIPSGRDGKPEALLNPAVYDGLMHGDPRCRFTAVHEAGHAILHSQHINIRLSDGRMPRLYRRETIARFRDPEWQADVWAGSFLMPTRAVLAIVQRSGADPRAVADMLNVSLSAAETRLYYMRKGGLLD